MKNEQTKVGTRRAMVINEIELCTEKARESICKAGDPGKNRALEIMLESLSEAEVDVNFYANWLIAADRGQVDTQITSKAAMREAFTRAIGAAHGVIDAIYRIIEEWE